jgi:hypothetical protein
LQIKVRKEFRKLKDERWKVRLEWDESGV